MSSHLHISRPSDEGTLEWQPDTWWKGAVEWILTGDNFVAVVIPVVALIVALLVALFGQGLLPHILEKLREHQRNSSRSRVESLPPRAPFYGRGDLVIELSEGHKSPLRLILEGPRGCGKSALALEIAYKVGRHYERFAWVDLKHRSVDLSTFVDYLARRVGVAYVEAIPNHTKAAALNDALSELSSRLLVVVDNFESVNPNDREAALALLNALPKNVAVIITTSRAMPFVHNMRLRHIGELLFQEARAIIEGELRNDPLLQNAHISEPQIEALYRRTGGSVLALKWVLGRIRSGLDVDTVLNSLGRYDEVLSELFDQSWSQLTPRAQAIAQQLAHIEVDPSPQLLQCIFEDMSYVAPLEELLRFKIVENFGASIGSAPRFLMHPLAREYALQVETVDSSINPRRGAEASLTYMRRFGENGPDEDMQLVSDDLAFVVARLNEILDEGIWELGSELAIACEESFLTLGQLRLRRDFCLTAAPHAVEDTNRPWRSRLRVVGAQAAGLMNDFDSSNSVLQSVLKDRNVADVDQVRRARRALAANYLRSGRNDDLSDEVFEQLVRDLSDTSDLYLKIDILYLLANREYNRCMFERSLQYCNSIENRVRDSGLYERALAYSAEQASLALLELGRAWQARQMALRARAVAVKFRDVRQIARIDLVRAKVFISVGLLGRARLLAASAHRTFEALGLINEREECSALLRTAGFGFVIRSLVPSQLECPKFKFAVLPIGGD